MASKRKFKDRLLQETYDWFLENDPDPSTKGKGSAHNAYYVGRHLNRPDRPFAQRGSVAYSAWAAGIDNARKSQHGTR